MSDKVLGDIVVMMHDPVFAEAVRTDPDAALGRFKLTPEEIEHVLALLPDHEDGVKQLAVRASKSALFFNHGFHEASAIATHHDAAAGISAAGLQQAASASSHAATIGDQAMAWATNIDPGYDEEGRAEVQGVDVAGDLAMGGDQLDAGAADAVDAAEQQAESELA
ncbi:MAG: hypothetical protein QOE92_1617 [Chloroflexota bacterium]|nr:hypothetical protein [Chloroflexota bacterium]